MSSSKLFSLVLTFPTEGTNLEELCSREELSVRLSFSSFLL